MNTVTESATKIVERFIRLAACCCIVSVVFGLIASIAYSNPKPLHLLGIGFQQIRPLHTFLGVSWIYLAGIACIYYFLFSKQSKVNKAFIWRAKIGCYLWVAGGLLTIWAVLTYRLTGREYLPLPPGVSLLIFVGWLFLTINFFSVSGWRMSKQPVYVWMWAVALLLFIWTFIEAHLYLVPWVSRQPTFDLALQWKSYGPLVGSFNLIVYGSLLYVSGQMRDDDTYAYSNVAFLFFLIGVLNSFTNYGHHTYHLPQSHLVKWIAFLVSMTESVILIKVLFDTLHFRRSWRRCKYAPLVVLLFFSASVWTILQLILALFLSVPPLNALVHGTHVVTAHAMGSMIGIDSLILLAVGTYLIFCCQPKIQPWLTNKKAKIMVMLLNVSLLLFWLSLLSKGVYYGWQRFTGLSVPVLEAVQNWFPLSFSLSGLGIAIGFIYLLLPWVLTSRSKDSEPATSETC